MNRRHPIRASGLGLRTGTSLCILWLGIFMLRHSRFGCIGGPPQTGELIGVRLQPDALRLLDEWRRGQEDLPGRPEAIRRLIDDGLAKKAKR